MSERTSLSGDVLVLGGGVAGLSAACELAHGGLSVTLLEARARFGGRILSEDVPGWTTPVELGAEFVHGRPAELFELIEAFGLTRESSHAPHLRKAARGLDQGGNFWRGIDEALEAIEPDAADVSAAEFLTTSNLSAEVGRALAGYLEGFHAGELARISMRSVVRQMSDDDSEQGRIREGYGSLIRHLAKDVLSAGARVVLKTRVNALRWEPSSVVALADGNEWRAKVALVALPLSVLKAGTAGGGVSVDPEPAAVRRGLDALEMGQALRVVLRIKRPIGLLETLPSGAFLHGIDGEFPTLWLGPNRHEAQVTTWCGGPRAMRLGERDARSIALAALRSVALGLDVSTEQLEENLLGAHVHSFGSDPFSLGAYPYALVGGDASGAFDPVQSTLFFAGDYTVPEELGTVGIAVKSGVSAAREILDVFGR